MPYGRTYPKYKARKTYRKQYRYYNKEGASGADRPDMWMQTIGMQLAYEKARMDYQVHLRQLNFVYSPSSFEIAQERLVQLMSTVGAYLKLGRSLDGFKDLDILGADVPLSTTPGILSPQQELLHVKYNITDLAKTNLITLYAKFLKNVYGEGYTMYSSRLNALPKVQNNTKTAQAMPDLTRSDDPRDLGLIQTVAEGPQLVDDLPNKWLTTADDVTLGYLPHGATEPIAKRTQ